MAHDLLVRPATEADVLDIFEITHMAFTRYARDISRKIPSRSSFPASFKSRSSRFKACSRFVPFPSTMAIRMAYRL